jgi:hypothetical protein
MRISFVSRPLAALTLAALLCGCTSRSQVFEGYADDQLWTAMVATARTPEYDDWKITENEVFVDETGRRVEIYRVLRRTLVSPYADARRETAEWRFQVALSADEGTPMIDFTARQAAVPAHVWTEADRYFAQMRTLLGPPATRASTAEAPPTESTAESTAEPTPEPTAEASNAPVEPAPAQTAPAIEPLPE